MTNKPLIIHIFSRGDPTNVNTWSGVPYYLCQGFLGHGAKLIYSDYSLPTISKLFNFLVSYANRFLSLLHLPLRLKYFQFSIFGQILSDFYIYSRTLFYSNANYNFFFSYTSGWFSFHKMKCILLHDQTIQQSIERNTIHGISLPINRLQHWRQIKTLHTASLIFATTMPTIKHLQNYYHNLPIHPAMLIFPKIYPIPKTIIPFHKTTHFELLFIGRDQYYRGLDVLFESLISLDNLKDLSIHLTVVGIGRDNISGLSVPENVTFYKYLDKTIPSQFSLYTKLLSEATIFVMPQRGSLLAGVLLEALFYSTPVITTNVPGIESFIENGVNGIILPRPDPNLFATAIHNTLTDVHFLESLSINAYNSVRHHSIHNATSEILEATAKAVATPK